MRWTLKPKPDPKKVKALQEAIKVDAVVARLLLQRGIETYDQAKTFFRPELSELHDPFLMRDMEKAVDRIEQAINDDENILIYGDYDVDGTTAVALMFSYLSSYYSKVATYIPDRYEEGYGISIKGIDFADDNGFSLIIALDCGIKALDQVAYANSKGIDFIICDHHRPGDQLPEAYAILDPKRTDCDYPFKELCGCGVGFKLIQALELNRGRSIDFLVPYLDLVVTAIAADIVPVSGENRILAYYGMQVINDSPRTGIKAILDQQKKAVFTITDLVFTVAPRINAAGRIQHGNYAVELLSEKDHDNARLAAEQIDGFNSERKDLDKEITKQALQLIEDSREKDKYTSVVFQSHWHKGVLGIVASRLIETYYRPTIVLTQDGEKLTGSARSVKGFDIYNALSECDDLLEKFGGHKYAAGLTMNIQHFEDFKARFEKVVAERISEHLRVQEILIDAEINIRDINPRLHRILSQFAPFGPDNMTPVFMSRDLFDTGYARPVGEDGDHLKLAVVQGNNSQQINAIGFNLGHKYEMVGNRKKFMAAFTIDENHWNGRIDLQLKLKDIKQDLKI
ncbi:MAG: single-stranded-DNA-specific exonuclease RecJ [Bacteroidia bacterium]|nr:single-stranded-DNA-specific exonuclease RecJ [Bacteroidia bacterium]NNK72874.1 single-stranded-DNA-specific exonuclease RecJ [Flavobacteriaceae bacterium]